MYKSKRNDGIMFKEKYVLSETRFATGFHVNVSSRCHEDTSGLTENRFGNWIHGEMSQTERHLKCSRCQLFTAQSLKNICSRIVLNDNSLRVNSGRLLFPMAFENLTTVAASLIDPARQDTIDALRNLLHQWSLINFSLSELIQTNVEVNQVIFDLLLQTVATRRMWNVENLGLTTPVSMEASEGVTMLLSKVLEILGSSNGTLPLLKFLWCDIRLNSYDQIHGLTVKASDLRRVRPSVKVKAARLHLIDIDHFDMQTLSAAIDCRFVESIRFQRFSIQHGHVIQLAELINPCFHKLSHLELEQDSNAKILYGRPNYPSHLASAMQQLLSNLPNVKRLTLTNFPILNVAGCYVFPPLIEELKFDRCSMTYDGWETWASTCRTSTLKHLIIVACHFSSSGNCDGLLNFVTKHAKTLEMLSIGIKDMKPSLDMFKRLAVNLAPHKTLREYVHVTDIHSELMAIMREVMPLVLAIESLTVFHLSKASRRNTVEDGNAAKAALRRLCLTCVKPFLSGTLHYDY